VSKKSRRAPGALSVIVVAGIARAQPLSESFDSVSSLPNFGWVPINASAPTGSAGWFQGTTSTFPPQSSAGYLAADYRSTGSVGTISDWMLFPPMTLTNGGMLQFWTRTVSPALYADRLQVRMSTAGTSTNIGATAMDVGDFGTLLLDINPTYLTSDPGSYPVAWTQYFMELTGLPGPTTGRLAFRYFVEHGGINGSNSNYIGIDSVRYSPTGIPQGRCCIASTGSCVVTNAAACLGMSGVYAGDWTVCSGFTCAQPPTGACCTAEGPCQLLSASACATAGGVFRGADTSCLNAACPHSFAYVGDPVEIPDGVGSSGCGPVASASVVVTSSFTVQSAEAAFAIAHLWQGDLRISLTKVGGPTVTLVDRPGYPQTTYGFSGDDYGAPLASPPAYFRSNAYANTTYDSPEVADPGINYPSGSWKAEAALSAFRGLDSAGTWRLDVTDCAGGDAGTINKFIVILDTAPPPCYANCDGSTAPPVLNANDFQCFLNLYAVGSSLANCDGSTSAPIINANDFQCFLNAYAAGCP
jgi:subtilisin-like proprotein convertase family protein